MAKFVVKEGEQVIERANAKDLQAGAKRGPGELILTDRRLVLTDSSNKSWTTLFGVFGGLFGAALSETRVACTIDRAELVEVDARGPGELAVRGYSEAAGTTRMHARVRNAAQWADQIQRWGRGEALEVAQAKLVKPQ